MHRASPAPFVDMRLDDGEMLIVVGKLRLQRCTRRGTRAIRCAWSSSDRVFTGDTLLIGGTGRTDLPTGDPDALYDSLFGKLLKLDPALRSIRRTTTRAAATRRSAQEMASNPRLQKRDRAEFVEMMQRLTWRCRPT